MNEEEILTEIREIEKNSGKNKICVCVIGIGRIGLPTALSFAKSGFKTIGVDINKNLDLGKLPPQALDLEESVLGALMLEKDALTDVIDILKPENFYKDANKEIYKSIIDLFNESEPVDLLTVTSQLKKNGKLEYVGGSYYVTQLTTRVNSASNIEYHARIILEQSIKRQLIEVSGEVQKDAYEDTTDVFDLLDNTEQSLHLRFQ